MIKQVKIWMVQHHDKSMVFVDQALVSGVNFLVGILLARCLGLEVYGMFTLAWMVVLFFSGLQQSFLIAPLYAITTKQNDEKSWLSQLNFVQLLFSLVCIPLTITILEVSFLLQPEWKTEGISLLVAFLISFFLLNDFFRRSLFRNQSGKVVFYMDLLGFGLQLVFISVLHFSGSLNLFSALGSIFLAQSASLAYYLFTEKPKFRMKGLLSTLGKLWKYSRYLLATSVLQWSSGNYFILASGAFLGPAAVGAIRMVQNLMGLLHIIFLALENLIPARAAAILKVGGNQALFHYLRKAFIGLLAPILFLIALLMAFHHKIIRFFYGEQQFEVGNILIAFAAIYLMVFVGTMIRFAIRTLEMNRMIFKSYIITTVFSLLMAQPFVVQWGVMGVVAGLAGTQLLSLIYFYFTLKNTFKWKIVSFI